RPAGWISEGKVGASLLRRALANADFDASRDSVGIYKVCQIVAEFCEPFRAGGGRVVRKGILDKLFVDCGIEYARCSFDHKHVGAIFAVVLAPLFVEQTGTFVGRRYSDHNRSGDAGQTGPQRVVNFEIRTRTCVRLPKSSLI